MLLRAAFTELLLLLFFTALIFNFLKQFKIKRNRALIFICPLITYALGFYWRMLADKNLVDLGFFFTEFSTLFVTILFTLFLYLGQVKYWGIK
jgi:hypothetical protein